MSRIYDSGEYARREAKRMYGSAVENDGLYLSVRRDDLIKILKDYLWGDVIKKAEQP